MNNSLIFGKNPLEKIVSIELIEDKSQFRVFFADKTCRDFDHFYYTLAPQAYDKSYIRLKGDLHYKYIKTYKKAKYYYGDKKKYRQQQKDFWSPSDPIEGIMLLHGLTFFKGMSPGDLNILSFDIESNGLKKDENSEVFMISNTFRKSNGEIERKVFRADHYYSFQDMIQDWCDWVSSIDPDVICGHNIFGYDLPFMKHCMDLAGKEMLLGKDGSTIQINDWDLEFRVDGSNSWTYKNARIFGRQIIDTMFLSVKYDFGRKYPAWALKQIIEFEKNEFLEKKKEWKPGDKEMYDRLSHGGNRQFYDAAKIRDNWQDKEEREKIVAYCFAPKVAQISLNNGSIKYIEDLQLSDVVITHDGTEGTILNTFQRQYNGQIYNLEIDGGRKIKKVTGEHPFYIFNENTLKYEWKKAKDLLVNDLLVKGEKNINIKNNKYDIYCSDFWWLFGLFLAEGYIRIQKTTKYPVFCIHEKEISIVTSILNKLNYHYCVVNDKRGKGVCVVVTCSVLGNLYLDMCDGKNKSNEVKINNDVFNYLNNNNEKSIHLISGFWDGDGHFGFFKKNEKVFRASLHVTSPHMTNLIDLLFSKLNINCTRLTDREIINKRTSNKLNIISRHKRNELWLFGDEARYLNSFSKLKNFNLPFNRLICKKLLRIKKIIKEEYSGMVYNVEVSNNNSYIVNGIISHNCQDDSDDSLILYDLMIPGYFYYTQSIPKSFQQVNNSATGSQINSFLIRSYLQEKHSLPKKSEPKKVSGGVSFGIPGVYHNVNKVDVSSLYPSIIRTYKIFDPIKDPNENFLKMVSHFTIQRLENKKLAKETGDRKYEDLMNSQKIFINSAYGLLGTPGLLFNSFDNADLVTSKGREILSKAVFWACGKNLKQITDPKTLTLKNKKKIWVLVETGEVGRGFTVVNGDTDSISYTAGKKITDEEFEQHLQEINNLMDVGISWEDDKRFKTVLVLKAKNYILQEYDKKKSLKKKGSAIKSPKREKAIKEFVNDLIDCLMNKKKDQIIRIYQNYCREIMKDSIDISRWGSKYSITDKVINAKRLNEQKVKDAVTGEEIKEGDKVYLYYNKEENLKLIEKYENDHSKEKYLEKMKKTLDIFKTVLDVELFPNYSKKGNIIEEEK